MKEGAIWGTRILWPALLHLSESSQYILQRNIFSSESLEFGLILSQNDFCNHYSVSSCDWFNKCDDSNRKKLKRILNHKHGSKVMLMKLHFNQWDLTVRVILICPSMQVTQKTTPDGTKRGLKRKKRATAGKTAREWTDENLISYSDKLSQSAQAVVKAMTVQGTSSS